jgi:hypothetical protein
MASLFLFYKELTDLGYLVANNQKDYRYGDEKPHERLKNTQSKVQGSCYQASYQHQNDHPLKNFPQYLVSHEIPPPKKMGS